MTELAETADYFFKDPAEYDEKQASKQFTTAVKPALDKLVEELPALSVWDKESIDACIEAVADSLEMKSGKIKPALRLAVTGVGGGPDLIDMFIQLGQSRTVTRIKKMHPIS